MGRHRQPLAAAKQIELDEVALASEAARPAFQDTHQGRLRPGILLVGERSSIAVTTRSLGRRMIFKRR